MLRTVKDNKVTATSLTPLIKTERTKNNKMMVMAVVKDDVHDVDKDIISTVLSCNSY